jgi:hypothetical protein
MPAALARALRDCGVEKAVAASAVCAARLLRLQHDPDFLLRPAGSEVAQGGA